MIGGAIATFLWVVVAVILAIGVTIGFLIGRRK